ncbi:hypothetical protein CsSME_00006535 [Camellia sinensis var. sinensis]
METQNLFFGFCPIQNPNNSLFPILPSSSSYCRSSSSSQILCPKRLCCKTLYPLSSKFLWLKTKLQCKNSLPEYVKPVSGDYEDLKTGIRKKNLAVFVSGGGSNFRSIHESILGGSIHGEIVVLVTNKPGMF